MPLITRLSRQLRNNMTEAEKILWQRLKNRQLRGLRFLRQKPIVYKQIEMKKFFFIVDFICYEKKIIIEVDGGIHNTQKSYDMERDKTLALMGFKIVRIKNEEVINDIKSTIRKIELIIDENEFT